MLLDRLIPGASVRLAQRKPDLPHARTLDLHLRDGRILQIWLDQGFGCWRAAGNIWFDFGASLAVQATTLASLATQVTMDSSAPIGLELR